MHARVPKDIPERLVRYGAFIEAQPEAHAGHWLEDFGNYVLPLSGGAVTRSVTERVNLPLCTLHVDLGCGKGAFCAHEAAVHPDTLYVGIDAEELCIAFAAQKAHELQAPNLRFVLTGADGLPNMFAPGEIDVLHLNFPTPHPRKKHARERLTYVDRLIVYRPLFAPGGTLRLKTDSQPFFDFSLIQFELAGYKVEHLTRDLHAECPGLPQTEYEQRLAAKGAKIHALVARPAAHPYTHEQTAELSLMKYLPDDLDALDYVPYGMEKAVENFRNRRKKEALKYEKNNSCTD